jgi:hypothetical protein
MAVATANCVVCAESFCDNCLVRIAHQPHCAKCKAVVLPPLAAPVLKTHACKPADDALKFAIGSIFCFAFITAPIALMKASDAKRLIAEDPSLSGEGKANAAIVIALITLLIQLVSIYGRLT